MALPIAAGVALLVRSGAAPWLFMLALVTILANNAYDIAAGTSMALVDGGWRTLTFVLVTMALLQCACAWRLQKRGVFTRPV